MHGPLKIKHFYDKTFFETDFEIFVGETTIDAY